jgi:hypothetical protein
MVLGTRGACQCHQHRLVVNSMRADGAGRGAELARLAVAGQPLGNEALMDD